MAETVDIHAPGVVVRKSACYFCHQNCGVLAYVKDGKVIKIEGDPEHVSNQGGLCCRGTTGLEFLDHPARINHALKRAGMKGENKWVQIPYDQAIKEIAQRLNQIKEESGAEAVATAGGTLRTDDWARRRFMNIFGSPNGFHNALLCWMPTFMVETAVSGWSPFETDLGNSRCLVLWGVNPGASNLPGMRGYTDLKKKGLKIIVVDPRYSETAAHADLWLPLRPGSDTALALAMLNTIIFERLYDKEFVDTWCTGFDELKAHVKPYTARWASEKTWLDAELIREAARMYANNTPGNIQWGCTADQLGKSTSAGAHARACIRAICGNLDCPGGDLMPGPAMNYITDEEMEANDWLPEEQKAKQIGADKYKLISWPGYQMIADISKEKWGKAPTAEWMCEAHGPSVFQAIITGDPYPVRAMIVLATNPISCYGDSKMILEAYKKCEFMVTVDYWMTPTALYSDYVLPAAGALERPVMHNNYGVTDSLVCSERAIQPMYDRHTDFTFWRSLALACGQPEEMWPWETEEEAFYYIVYPTGYPMESYDDFVENYRYYYPPQQFYKYSQNGFCTRSGKVELKSSVLERLGYPALPTYFGPSENEEDDPEVAAEYPMVLTTGGGFMPFHHSEHFNNMKVRYISPDPYFTINPETAEKMGIQDGDWCWIETRRGRIKQRANVEPAVDPRVIYAPRGWWHPERGPKGIDPFGCIESNVNTLTSVEAADCDPVSGAWPTRGLMCKVYKVRPGDDKTDITWSIPSNATTPGVSVKPSDQKLAIEPIPYIPPEPDFEVPEGLVWDPDTETAWDETHTLAYDPESGWMYNPQTGVCYDLYTFYAYDPENEWLVDESTGIRYDLETREPLDDVSAFTKTPVDPRNTPAAPKSFGEAPAALEAAHIKAINDGAPFDVPAGFLYDAEGGWAWSFDQTKYYDPESGWAIDNESGVYYDVTTGWAYDPETEDLVDEDGVHHPLGGEEEAVADDGTFGLSALYDMDWVAQQNAQAPFEVPDGLLYDAEGGYAWTADQSKYYDAESGWLIDATTEEYFDAYTQWRYDGDNECLVDDATGIMYDMATREPLPGQEDLLAAPAQEEYEIPSAPTSFVGEDAAADIVAQAALPTALRRPAVTGLSADEIAERNAQAPFAVPAGLVYDPATNLAWDEQHKLAYDTESGWLYDPETSEFFDVATRAPYGAEAAAAAPAASFELVDADDGFTWTADGTKYLDQASGWLIDINTGDYYDAQTGYAYDAASGDLVDAADNHYDLTTRALKGAKKVAEAAVAAAPAAGIELVEAQDGFTWTADGTKYLDQASGWLIDINTGDYYDAQTGYAYDAASGDLVDAAGCHYDLTTRDIITR